MRATSGDRSYTSKLIDGTFPDYQRIIFPNDTPHFLFQRAQLLRAVERIACVTAESVVMKWTAEATTIEIRSRDAGFEEVECESFGLPEGSVTVSPSRMAEMVSVIDSDDMTLYVERDGKQLRFGIPHRPQYVAILAVIDRPETPAT
jgi:DNA polymerase III sliding clamp (beta) subunit (PCNA family)